VDVGSIRGSLRFLYVVRIESRSRVSKSSSASSTAFGNVIADFSGFTSHTWSNTAVVVQQVATDISELAEMLTSRLMASGARRRTDVQRLTSRLVEAVILQTRLPCRRMQTRFPG
jgi:hypothetical protein